MTEGARHRAYRLGLRAETVAAWFLRLKGYRIIAARYRTPVGELDLVALRRRRVVFVEVKARASETAAIEAVDGRAQRRIARAAAVFLQRHRSLAHLDQRYDLVLVLPRRWPRHIAGAFDNPTV